MPRLNSMSWDKGRGNRWRKWYKGVLHVVTCEELGVPRVQGAVVLGGECLVGAEEGRDRPRRAAAPHAAGP